MKQHLLVASSNIGIGLWTSICLSFCSIFGRQSQNYKKKQDRVLNAANKNWLSNLKNLAMGTN